MWARVLECSFACWLAISPFVFRYEAEDGWLWIHDYITASLILAFGLLSYWPPTKHAHLLTAACACWLIGIGRFSSPQDIDPPLQNYIVTGLFLVMLAVVPNEAARPPVAWRGEQKDETKAGY